MTHTSKASPPTTLQKLQALDKQYLALDEKLDQITLILKDVNICSSQFLTSLDHNSGGAKYHGRTEWAVRWAVGMLHGDTKEAKECVYCTELRGSTLTSMCCSARANIRMWYLIRNLVATLPSRVTARTLNSQAFLAAVVSALQELILGGGLDSHPMRAEGTTGYRHTSDTIHSKPTLSSKRKLSNERGHLSSVKKQKTEHNQFEPVGVTQSLPRLLYHAIMACLRSVELESTAMPYGSFRHEHMTSTLRTDSSTAAIVLASWFQIQNLFLQDVNEIEYKNIVANSESANDLTQVLRIWNSRQITEPGNDNVSSHEFSTKCFLPATIFLEISRKIGNYSDKDVRSIARSTERLIAQHIFLPSRSAFLTHRNGAADAADPANDHLWILLRPLLGLQPQKHSKTDETRRLAVSRLFELAARCCPLNTPKKRATESRWLNQLFSNLAACIEHEALSNESKDPSTPPSTNLEPIRIMLQTAIEQNISINPDLLEMIISKYSGLITGDGIDWNIVAQVINLESSLFTGGRPGKRGDGDSLYLVKILFSRITDRIWTTLRGEKEHLEKGALQAEYESVRSNIIAPLLRAFASSRQLPSFLNLWRRQLTDLRSNRNITFANSVSGSGHLSVWEDYVVVDNLSEVITIAMTYHRVQEFVENLGSAFERLMNLDEYEYNPYGDLSLLALLLQGLEEYEILQKLQPLLSQFFLRCVTTLIDDGSVESLMAVAIWKLSSIIHGKLTKIGKCADTKGDVKRLAEFARNQMILYESQPAFGVDELAALLTATWSQVCNLRSRHLVLEEDTVWITQLREATFRLSQEQKSAAAAEAFALIAAASPSLLHFKQNDTSRSQKRPNMVTEWATSSNEASAIWQLILSETSIDANANDIHASIGDLSIIQSTVLLPTQQVANERTIRFLAESYSYIPPLIVPRWQREQFVDMSVAFVCGLAVVDEYESIERLLSAIIKFLRVPCGNSDLVKNAQSLYGLVTHVDKLLIDRFSKDHVELSVSVALDLLECLASQVFLNRFAINDATEFREKVKVFEHETKDWLHHEIKARPHPAMLRVLFSGISFLALSSKRFPSNHDSWRNLQTEMCGIVCDQLALLERDQRTLESAMSAYAQLQGVELLRLLTALENDVLSANESTLGKSLKTYMDTKPQGNPKLISERVLQYKVACKTNSSKKELLDVPLSIDQFAAANPSEQIAVRRITMYAFQNMNPEQRVTAFRATMHGVRTSPDVRGSLDMLRIAMKALTEHPQDMGKHFSDGIVLSCERLVLTNDLQQFYLLTNILSMIKKAKFKELSQNALEAIQSALLSVASASAPSLPSKAAGIIFNRLCAIARLVLSTHRRKLRGRFSILTHLLQALLRCLFIPVGASSGTSPTAVKQPSWLSAEFPLTTKQATTFTRLLTLVCEPSTSSVASSKSNQPKLMDETRQARSYAGQHMPYILMEYCNSQLHGRLTDPGMREQLMPGLYAACRVVELAGVQEATMSALSAPARVGLKELWDDWRKFGRWDGA